MSFTLETPPRIGQETLLRIATQSDPASRALRLSVLIVEGDVVARMIIAERVRRQGLEVLEAATTEEAVIAIGSQAPIGLIVTKARATGELEALGWQTRFLLADQRIVMVSGGAVAREVEVTADRVRDSLDYVT